MKHDNIHLHANKQAAGLVVASRLEFTEIILVNISIINITVCLYYNLILECHCRQVYGDSHANLNANIIIALFYYYSNKLYINGFLLKWFERNRNRHRNLFTRQSWLFEVKLARSKDIEEI